MGCFANKRYFFQQNSFSLFAWEKGDNSYHSLEGNDTSSKSGERKNRVAWFAKMMYPMIILIRNPTQISARSIGNKLALHTCNWISWILLLTNHTQVMYAAACNDRKRQLYKYFLKKFQPCPSCEVLASWHQ